MPSSSRRRVLLFDVDGTLVHAAGAGRRSLERVLAGAVGTAAASTVVEQYLALKGSTLEEIFDVFQAVSLSLEESREELESRVRELSVLFELPLETVRDLSRYRRGLAAGGQVGVDEVADEIGRRNGEVRGILCAGFLCSWLGHGDGRST